MRTVVYARVSTLDQAEKEKISIPEQVAWAQSLSKDKGWTFVKSYIEPGLTGDTDIESRKSLQKLLAEAEADLFDLVLIYHSSRLAREADVGLRVCRLLGNLRKQVYIRNSPIEPVPPQDFFWGSNVGGMYMNAFAFVGDLGENIARGERVRIGSKGLAQRGVLRNAPFGFIKKAKIVTGENGKQQYTWTFDTDPVKSQLVQDLFTTYAKEGASLKQMLVKLNLDQVPAPSGKVGPQAWSSATLKNLLTNPAYVGRVRWGRKLGSKYREGKSKTGRVRRVILPAEKWIDVTGVNFTGFVSEEIFNQVQEKLKSRGVLHGRAIASLGLLTGKVICAKCGKKAHYKTRRIHKRGKEYLRSDYICSTYVHYKTCTRYLMAGIKLHDAVVGEIDKIASDKKYREQLFTSYLPTQESSKAQIEKLHEAIVNLEIKAERLLAAYESGVLDLSAYARRKRGLDKELLDTRKVLEEKNNLDLLKKKAEEAKIRFMELAAHFREEFSKSEFAGQKELLSRLIDSVEVGSGLIRIHPAL